MAKRARIIVVGCSLFGCAVAQALSAAGHDVIVVDMQEDALDGLGPDFDGETLTGDGKSALVLEECAHMARLTEQFAPGAAPAPSYLQDKHYFRKHGPNAYYGQK